MRPPAAEPPPPAASAGVDDAFAGLLVEVALAIEASVPPWRVRLGEAVARWQADGVATAVLERALRLAEPPDVDGLLEAFASAVARLRGLAAEAADLDPALAAHPAFGDPTRVAEAAALVAARRAARALGVERIDRECWVDTWPDTASLLVEGDA